MSRKRTAAYQLTDSNWDAEDSGDEEEVEIIEPENKEKVFPERKFKKAVRRGVKSAGKGESGINPFQGLTGFSGFGAITTASVETGIKSKPITSIASAAAKGPGASFWTQSTGGASFFNPSLPPAKIDFTAGSQITSSSLFQNSVVTTEKSNSLSTNGNTQSMSVTNGKTLTNGKTNFEAEPVKRSPRMEKNSDTKSKYTDQIVDLNTSFLSWIKQHIDDNPCIDLTPVFKDYEVYMTRIEETHSKTKDDTKEVAKEEGTKSAPPQVSPISDPAPKKVGFFSPTLSAEKDTDLSIANNVSPKAPGFFASLATSTPVPPQVTPPVNQPDGEGENSVSDPKVERKTVIEEDAFFTTRCKLFYKKMDSWQDLGLGMLYLKPMNGKTQLLVRMETSLGKVLLNICLLPETPCARTGKNNVTLVSVPNPPVFLKEKDGDNSKPLTYLIRVKGGVEADELFAKIQEKKESS